jgi:hypothetical protein
LQAWYISVASPTGESGSINSVVRANSGAAAGKLVVEAIKILGLPSHTEGLQLTVSVGGKALQKSAVQRQGDNLTISGLKNVVGEQLEVIWQYVGVKRLSDSEL